MAQVFGVTTQNLQNVKQNLKDYAKNILILDIDYRSNNHKKIAKADLILISNIKTYNSIVPILNKTEVVCIIFESPYVLNNQNIDILDSAGEDILNIKFNSKKLDYSPVVKALAEPKSSVLAKVNRDVLNDIIKNYSAGGFLDKFNTYIYQATTPRTKPAVRKDLVQYVFGKQSKEQTIASVVKHGAKNGAESQALLQQITDYMQSEPGINMRKALLKAIEMENAASINARRTISYKKLIEEFNVDKFELRNLLLLYRNKS